VTKVKIIITDKESDGKPCIFTGGDKEGQAFISVEFMANSYGSASPCTTNEEVESAILHAKEWITREGDTYEVDDKRVTLSQWL
jgi:hypothetical protein